MQPELLLHGEVLKGDHSAWGKLVEIFFDTLVQNLSATCACIDPDMIVDGVVGGLERYRDHAERYDPERGPLLPYLHRICKCCAIDLLREAAWRRHHEVSLSNKNLEENKKRADGNRPPQTDIYVDGEELEAELRELATLLSPQECRFLALDRRAPTGHALDELVDALGVFIRPLCDVPVAEKKQAIEVARNRIRRKLKRKAHAMSLDWDAKISPIYLNFALLEPPRPAPTADTAWL